MLRQIRSFTAPASEGNSATLWSGCLGRQPQEPVYQQPGHVGKPHIGIWSNRFIINLVREVASLLVQGTIGFEPWTAGLPAGSLVVKRGQDLIRLDQDFHSLRGTRTYLKVRNREGLGGFPWKRITTQAIMTKRDIEQNTKFRNFAAGYMDDLLQQLEDLDLETVHTATKAIRGCKGIVWLAGNGGSGALASHMAVDLQLAGVRAQALMDPVAITCYANDQHYSECFAAQIYRMVRPQDLLVLISTSGRSANLLNTYGVTDVPILSLTGKNGGPEFGQENYSLHVPSMHTGVIQDIQQVMLHLICYWLMEESR